MREPVTVPYAKSGTWLQGEVRELARLDHIHTVDGLCVKDRSYECTAPKWRQGETVSVEQPKKALLRTQTARIWATFIGAYLFFMLTLGMLCFFTGGGALGYFTLTGAFAFFALAGWAVPKINRWIEEGESNAKR